MKRQKNILSTLGLLAIALGALANAQANPDDTYTAKPYSVQLGINRLLNLRTHSTSPTGPLADDKYTGINVALGYSLSTSSPRKASVDLVFNTTASGDADRISSTGLFYTIRAPFRRKLYAGLGVGLVYNNFQSGGSRYSVSSVRTSTSRTNPGMNLLIGKSLSRHMTAEAGYQVAGSVKGVKADSFKIAVGYRF
jgi:outer membrane protein assembly factor BamA